MKENTHRTLAKCYFFFAGCCYWLLCGRGRRRDHCCCCRRCCCRIGHNAWFPCINKDNTSILINLSEACKCLVCSLVLVLVSPFSSTWLSSSLSLLPHGFYSVHVSGFAFIFSFIYLFTFCSVFTLFWPLWNFNVQFFFDIRSKCLWNFSTSK